MDWNGKPYHSLDCYLRETFGKKVYKLALDGGMTCPNRDGTLGTGGCIFCSEGGSGDFAAPRLDTVSRQIEEARKRLDAKLGNRDVSYIAYFQSYTNTYAPLPRLEQLFSQAIRHPEVSVLSVATRPDCLPPETVDLLARLNREKPVWVELGLQTIHEKTARLIRQGYELPCFLDAFERLKTAGLSVIVHVILGLPGESRSDMLETVRFLGSLRAGGLQTPSLPAGSALSAEAPGTDHIDGIKLQLLHILKGTELARLYEREPFPVMEPEEYVSLIADCIRLLPQDIVIHRISGDGPKRLLIAPEWSANKRFVLNSIARALRETGAYQGEWV